MGDHAPDTLTTARPAEDAPAAMFWTLIPAAALGVADWSDQRELHRAVMSLFPAILPGAEETRRATSRILFRVDETAAGRVVLIQSAVAPSRVPAAGRVKTLPPFAALIPGAAVRFRIAINAVERSRRPDGRTHETPLPEDRVDSWLAAKLTGALADVSVLNSARSVYGVDRKGPKGLKAAAQSALQVDTIDGVGTVDDATRLLTLTLDGVGRAKAYGCGLLTVSALG